MDVPIFLRYDESNILKSLTTLVNKMMVQEIIIKNQNIYIKRDRDQVPIFILTKTILLK